jgi:hypothetical protein
LSQSQSLIETSKPVFVEGLIAILLGLVFVSSITATDIAFHDDYVKIIISWCHPDNQDAFCTDFREKHGLDEDAHLEIGNKYWNRLLGQSLEIFAGLFLTRLAFGYLLQIGVHKKIRITTFLIAIIWGASASTLFMFGVLDTLYFVFQGIPIPDTLDWLNGAGVFTESKEWFGDPTVVDKNDLFATNIVGVSLLVALVFLNAIVYKVNGFAHRGIS